MRRSSLARALPYKHLAGQGLHHLALLIFGHAFNRDHAALRPRAGRGHRQHLAFHLEHIPRAHRPGPVDFGPGADQPAGNGHAAFYQQRHGDAGGVPAAGGQAAEKTGLGRHFVGVEGLGVEACGKALDLVRRHGAGIADEALAHREVFQKQFGHGLLISGPAQVRLPLSDRNSYRPIHLETDPSLRRLTMCRSKDVMAGRLSRNKMHPERSRRSRIGAKTRKIFLHTKNHGVNDMAARKKKKAKKAAKPKKGKKKAAPKKAKKSAKKSAKKAPAKKAKRPAKKKAAARKAKPAAAAAPAPAPSETPPAALPGL